MNVESIVSELAQIIQKQANIDAIFGEPKKLDEHTIVPVARVKITLNGGGGMGSGIGPEIGKPAEGDAGQAGHKPVMGGSGGGGAGSLLVEVEPLGFIRDGKTGAEFVAIEPAPEGLLGKVEHLVKGLTAAGQTGNH